MTGDVKHLGGSTDSQRVVEGDSIGPVGTGELVTGVGLVSRQDLLPSKNASLKSCSCIRNQNSTS